MSYPQQIEPNNYLIIFCLSLKTSGTGIWSTFLRMGLNWKYLLEIIQPLYLYFFTLFTWRSTYQSITGYHKIILLMLLACHKKSYFICDEITKFPIFTKPSPFFFQSTKLRQPKQCRDSFLKKILHNISKIHNLVMYQITYLMICQQY